MLDRLVVAVAIVVAIVLLAARASADEERPRLIGTIALGAGNEWALDALVEVRTIADLYVGAGYGATLHPSDVAYHGVLVRAGYRLAPASWFAITPRAGVDVVVDAKRMGSTEYVAVTGHFPLAGAAGALAALYLGPIVVGVDGGMSLISIQKEGSCTYAADEPACDAGAETVGRPHSEVVVGGHVGLALGAAF